MSGTWLPWAECKIEELKRLWAEGYSATDIAKTLGGALTRCAVLGKVHRLGLVRPKLNGNHKRREPSKGGRRTRSQSSASRGRTVVSPAIAVEGRPSPSPSAPPPPPPVEPLKKPHMRRLQLMQLTDRHCRWPIGDPHHHPFYFCAADRIGGEVYCPFHMSKAFSRR